MLKKNAFLNAKMDFIITSLWIHFIHFILYTYTLNLYTHLLFMPAYENYSDFLEIVGWR